MEGERWKKVSLIELISLQGCERLMVWWLVVHHNRILQTVGGVSGSV